MSYVALNFRCMAAKSAIGRYLDIVEFSNWRFYRPLDGVYCRTHCNSDCSIISGSDYMFNEWSTIVVVTSYSLEHFPGRIEVAITACIK